MIGGLPAFPVLDAAGSHRAPLLAVQTQPGLPPRARLLSGRAAAPVPQTMMPLDHGPGRAPNGTEAIFVICAQPPGQAIATDPRPWSETEIIRYLLLPAPPSPWTTLAERGIAHRAINPSNIFRAGPNDKSGAGPLLGRAAGQPATRRLRTSL